MYLVSLFIGLDVDPEVNQHDRERLLQSLRQKLKQKFQHKLSIKFDVHQMSMFVAFLDDNYEKLMHKVDQIVDYVEACGEARIRFSQEQVFSWYETSFRDITKNDDEFEERKSRGVEKLKIPTRLTRPEKTIVYSDSDDDDGLSKISQRFSRKYLRIPSGK